MGDGTSGRRRSPLRHSLNYVHICEAVRKGFFWRETDSGVHAQAAQSDLHSVPSGISSRSACLGQRFHDPHIRSVLTSMELDACWRRWQKWTWTSTVMSGGRRAINRVPQSSHGQVFDFYRTCQADMHQNLNWGF